MSQSNTNENDVPIVYLSEKERRDSDRAYRKFMRRRGIPASYGTLKKEEDYV